MRLGSSDPFVRSNEREIEKTTRFGEERDCGQKGGGWNPAATPCYPLRGEDSVFVHCWKVKGGTSHSTMQSKEKKGRKEFHESSDPTIQGLHGREGVKAQNPLCTK